MCAKKSYYAPAERVSSGRLDTQVCLFADKNTQYSFGNALPIIFLILNEARQVVYANNRALEVLGAEEFDCILGKRVGEVFHCVHATEEVGGCGTSHDCKKCGAVNAMLESQQGIQSIKECHLTMAGDLSADFRVWATPHEEAGEFFTFFTLQDIQYEKQSKAMTRTFFHDVLNTAGSITGLAECLTYVNDEKEKEELFTLLNKSSHMLIEEIRTGRSLMMAENGELMLELASVDIREIIYDCMLSYQNHPAGIGKQIKIREGSTNMTIRMDRVILERVIGNLIKNALEASDEGGLVTVGSTADTEGVTIDVHNTTVMPPEVKTKVFKRSFPTKGTCRGIGTYSIRLFTEKYLKGKVSFTSEKSSGTTFYIKLRKEIS